MAKIEFESVSIKNFMSFGNAEVTFDYKKGINIVTGKNGLGKSTLLADSLSFGIYAKVVRGGKVILGDIVNKINKKDCSITVILRVDGERLKVVRTIKPNDLKIYVGDKEELKKFDANGRNQEWLEKKIGISHICFNNIIVLNVNSTTPFLDMEAQKKRDVIENILASDVYGRMSNIAKDRHLDFKTEARACEVAFQVTSKQLESAKLTLSRHQEVIDRQKSEKEKKINLIKTEISKLESKINDLTSQLGLCVEVSEEGKASLSKSIRLKDSIINELRTNIRIAQTESARLKEALSHLENVPHCPTCHVPSDNPYIQKYIKELKDGIVAQDVIVVECKQKGSIAVKEKEALELELQTMNRAKEISDKYKRDIDLTNVQLANKNNELKNEANRRIEQGGVSEEDVTKLEAQVKLEAEKLDKAAKALQHYTAIRQILGEDGLRKFVVSKILPILNSKVNEYLKLLGSEYSLAFNMSLDEKILSRNREERPYHSFSSGEKKRLDLSILLALMYISMRQHSVETNILVLDEVLDTSMDSEGVENFLDFLKTGFKKAYPDKCVYIVTHHKEISKDNFDRSINLTKLNNFTTIGSIIEMSG